jgi:hypothetical protein
MQSPSDSRPPVPTPPAGVGYDHDGEVHRPELTNGNYGWTEVKDTITASGGAVRMALFFGVRPCKGKVEFDDINLRTADARESSAGPVVQP